MHLDVSIVASRGAVLELSRLVTRRSSLGEGVGVKVDVVFDEGRDEKVRVVVAYARTHVSTYMRNVPNDLEGTLTFARLGICLIT